MQLTNSTLSDRPTLATTAKPFSNKELDEAAEWVALHLSKHTQKDYLQPTGKLRPLLRQFILAVRNALAYVINQYLEIPYIWVHRCDYILHFGPSQGYWQRVELLTRDELWKVGIDFGLPPHQIAENFSNAGQKANFPDDQDLPPHAYAERFITNTHPTAENALVTTRMIIATELEWDPRLRETICMQFKEQALLSYKPTEKGKTKIDEAHACYAFKFLVDKPVEALTTGPQYITFSPPNLSCY
ncbi:Transcription elongation factor spt6 [Ceratobasidium sp. 428]|nr:Transcription elongation factor spt6 [Ceratobasidium sp. 428]